MADWWWILGSLAAVAILAVVFVWRPMHAAMCDARLADARRSFHVQRERLEAKFVQLGTAHAKPSAPRWADCEFDNDVAYVRNRSTGELAAFVAITITLEEFDDSSASTAGPAGNLRAGTAVFRHDRDHWETDGLALLNLSPSEAIRFYQHDLEMVAQESAGLVRG